MTEREYMLAEYRRLIESLPMHARARVITTPDQVRLLREAGLDLTQRELSILLGITRGGVAMTELRAMAKLRKFMGVPA